MSSPSPVAATVIRQLTGPAAITGKHGSSNNATLHGGTSQKLIVPGENPADFDTLLNGLMEDYRPETSQAHHFVENVATAQWFLWRRQRASSAIEKAIYKEQPDPGKWTEQHLKRLALADRYRTQAERSLKRALHNIEGLQKWARREDDRAIRQAQWQAAQDIRERRMTLQEEKFKLAQAREAGRSFRFAKNAVSSPDASECNHSSLKNNGEVTLLERISDRQNSAKVA